jgi:hypothetical protein
MDGQAAEPHQGTPSTRALGAMESAVRRARESAGGAALPPPPPPPLPQSHRVESVSPTADPAIELQRDRWLIAAVAVVAVLIVAGSVGLAVSLATGNGPPTAVAPSSSVTTPGHAGVPPPAHHSGAAGGGSSSGTSPSSNGTTTSTAAAAPGGPPVISTLNPSSGTAGEAVQIAGSNFMSSTGLIVATFNGQMASTNCPTQNTCSVTVPPSKGVSSAQVTISTAGGTSNAVTFTYR